MPNPNQAPAGCSAVMEHLNRPIPETLWHYTSFAGFQGIITSKSIWATEYRFLNDSEEVTHGRKLATELVEEEPEFVGLRLPWRDTIRSAVNIAFNTGLLHQDRLSIMVASFSEASDQLSQWRGYNGNSTGVSIGLDLRHLRPAPTLGTSVAFAPCVYKETEKRQLLKAVITHYRDSMEKVWDSIIEVGLKQNVKQPDPNTVRKYVQENSVLLSNSVGEAHEALQWDLLRLAALLKDRSFSEEREWRLTLPREIIHLPSHHPVNFRYQHDTLVPFIAYPLRLPNQEGPILCKEVIIGPGSHPQAQAAINMFLASQEIPTMARASEVPYRPSS